MCPRFDNIFIRKLNMTHKAMTQGVSASFQVCLSYDNINYDHIGVNNGEN